MTRLPPHNLHAERAMLGAALHSREARLECVPLVKPEDFYNPAHGLIWQSLTAVIAKGETVTAITTGEQLTRDGLIDHAGGHEYLLDLMANTPAISTAPSHARIIAELALQRRLIVAGKEIEELGYSAPEVAEAVEAAEKIIFDLAMGRRQAKSETLLRDSLEAAVERLEQLYERGSSVIGVPTGYHDFDQLLSGLQPSGLYVLGARPAVGKTAWALGAAMHVATVEQRPVMFFSLEMSEGELTQRILCSTARVDSVKVRSGRLNDRDWPRISDATNHLVAAPLWIDDNPNTTVLEILSKARKRKAKDGDLGLIVVDYVQLMTGRSGAENRQVEVAEISRGLKILARELEVPVLALAQLNRGLEQRADKRPMLSDLRESGALEQDADAVIFLYRDEVYHQDTPDKGIAEVIVAKHRQGPTGTVRLAYLSQYTKFVTMASAA